MKKIMYVAHCILNTAAKVCTDSKALESENEARRLFLSKALASDIQLIQLPCPEFSLYGPRRWGHVKDQFDNPLYKSSASDLLKQFYNQMATYYMEPEKFKILGIVGIDGSPSCGVNLTCTSKSWMGEFSERTTDLKKDLDSIKMVAEPGVFTDLIKSELNQRNISINFFSLSELTVQKMDEIF